MNTKESLIKSKLINFTKFLQDIPENGGVNLSDNSIVIITMKKYIDNPLLAIEQLLPFTHMAKPDGSVDETYIRLYLQGINFDIMDEKVKEKINRYIKCFVLILRS